MVTVNTIREKDFVRELPTSKVVVDAISAAKIVRSYGAMTETMQFLPPFERLSLQGLSKWMYEIGVGRVQTRITFKKMFFFNDFWSGYELERKLIASDNTGTLKLVDFSGETNFSSH